MTFSKLGIFLRFNKVGDSLTPSEDTPEVPEEPED